MTHRLSPSARAALVALLLATGTAPIARAQDATPVPPVALERQLAAIASETDDVRELAPIPDIDDVVLTRDELVQRLPVMITEELDPAELEGATRALIALGLLPEGSDLLDLTLRLLGEQVAGFYDPLTDEMIVVADGDF